MARSSDHGRRYGLENVLKYEKQNYGLSNVDIVLIHGAHDDGHEPYRHSQTGFFWPEEFLKTREHQVRMLSWGWDPSILGAIGTLDDLARGLLADIYSYGHGLGDRPIILVAKDIGGIIVEAALVEAIRHEHSHYASISDNIKAVMFLGTPHCGSEGIHISRSFWRPWGLIGVSSRTLMSEELGNKSEYLRHLSSLVRQIVQIRQIKVCSCWATKVRDQWGVKLVVKEKAALLYCQDERQMPLDADHTGLTKFSERQDATYLRLIAILDEWLACFGQSPNIPGDPNHKSTPVVQILPPKFNELNADGQALDEAIKINQNNMPPPVPRSDVSVEPANQFRDICGDLCRRLLCGIWPLRFRDRHYDEYYDTPAHPNISELPNAAILELPAESMPIELGMDWGYAEQIFEPSLPELGTATLSQSATVTTDTLPKGSEKHDDWPSSSPNASLATEKHPRSPLMPVLLKSYLPELDSSCSSPTIHQTLNVVDQPSISAALPPVSQSELRPKTFDLNASSDLSSMKVRPTVPTLVIQDVELSPTQGLVDIDSEVATHEAGSPSEFFSHRMPIEIYTDEGWRSTKALVSVDDQENLISLEYATKIRLTRQLRRFDHVSICFRGGPDKIQQCREFYVVPHLQESVVLAGYPRSPDRDSGYVPSPGSAQARNVSGASSQSFDIWPTPNGTSPVGFNRPRVSTMNSSASPRSPSGGNRFLGDPGFAWTPVSPASQQAPVLSTPISPYLSVDQPSQPSDLQTDALPHILTRQLSDAVTALSSNSSDANNTLSNNLAAGALGISATSSAVTALLAFQKLRQDESIHQYTKTKDEEQRNYDRAQNDEDRKYRAANDEKNRVLALKIHEETMRKEAQDRQRPPTPGPSHQSPRPPKPQLRINTNDQSVVPANIVDIPSVPLDSPHHSSPNGSVHSHQGSSSPLCVASTTVIMTDGSTMAIDTAGDEENRRPGGSPLPVTSLGDSRLRTSSNDLYYLTPNRSRANFQDQAEVTPAQSTATSEQSRLSFQATTPDSTPQTLPTSISPTEEQQGDDENALAVGIEQIKNDDGSMEVDVGTEDTTSWMAESQKGLDTFEMADLTNIGAWTEERGQAHQNDQEDQTELREEDLDDEMVLQASPKVCAEMEPAEWG